MPLVRKKEGSRNPLRHGSKMMVLAVVLMLHFTQSVSSQPVSTTNRPDDDTLIKEAITTLDLKNASCVVFAGGNNAGINELKKLLRHDETLTVEKVKNKFKLDAHEEKTFVPTVSFDLESRSRLFTLTDAEPDMPAQLFNRRIFESAGGLKVAIVESFEDLIGDQYYETLSKAMKNVINVLGDKLEWYSNSLCIVATKIDRKDLNDTELIGELEYKVGEFVKYMEKLREEAMENNDLEAVTELNGQITFGNYLLRKKQFGILRTPNAKKSPWDLPPINKNYNQLRRLIFKKMEFSLRIGSAAEVAVTPETRKSVKNKYLPKAETQMKNITEEFASSLEKALYGKLFNKFNAFWADFLEAAFNRLTSFAHLESLVKLLEVPSKRGEDVGSVAYRIKFYYEVIGNSFEEYEEREIAGCKALFRKILNQASNNHEFLENMRREHDTFEVQMHLMQDQSALLNGLSVDNFTTWQKNLTQLGFSDSTTKVKTKGNDVLVHKIESLARSVPANEFEENSSNGLFVYSGHYVFLSQVMNIFPGNTTHEVEIIALRKLFVDCDLELRDTHLTIWTPVMEIAASKKSFTLKGSDAAAPTNTPGMNGDDGYSSGVFYVFTQEVVNAGSLLVEIKGGNGADGVVGSDGKVDDDETFHKDADLEHFRGQVRERSQWINDHLTDYKSTCKQHSCNNSGKNCQYEVDNDKNFNKVPDPGNKGGDGGAGAFPGGFRCNENVSITKRNGTHGRPASGGKGGSLVRIIRYYHCYNPRGTYDDICDIKVYPPHYFVNGSYGHNGDYPTSLVAENYMYGNPRALFDSYLRLNLLAVFSPSPISPDYKFLSFASAEIVQDLETKHFFQFLGAVQDAFVNTTYTANLKIVVSSFYELFSIYKGLDKETDPSYLNLIELMFVDTLSKCDSLSSGRQVVNLAKTTEMEIERLDGVKNITQDLFVYVCLKKEAEDAAKEIADAEAELHEFYEEEMVEIKKDVDILLDQLVVNIYEEQMEYEQNISELEKQKKEYKRAMRRKKIAGIFKTSFNIAGVFNTPCAIASIILPQLGNEGSGGAGNIEDLRPDITNAADNAAAVAFEYWLTRGNNTRSTQGAQLEAMQLFLKDTELVSQVLNEEESERAIQVVEEALKLENVDDEEWDVFYETFDSVEGKIIVARANNAGNQDDQVKLMVYETVFGAAKEGFLPIKDVGHFINDINSPNGNLEMFDEAIDENKVAIEQLELFEKMIETLFIPMLEDMAKRLDDMQNDLSDANSVLTDIKAFEMKKKIKEFADFCNRFTDGLLEEDGFNDLSAQLQEVVSVLADGNDKIDEIGYRLEMKQFMGGLAGEECSQATDGETCIAYKRALSEVNKSHLLVAFIDIFAAYRQVIFPFASDKVKILGDLVHDLRNTSLETNGEIEQVKVSLQLIKNDLDKTSNSITDGDKDIMIYNFNPNYATGRPFYTWPAGNGYLAQVESLLMGKEVSLVAPASPQEKKNAIKFKTVGLNLTSTDPKVNARVQDLLMNFWLETTHVGPSQYKCGSSNFVISGTPLDFVASFELDNDGDPIAENNEVFKLRYGDVPLSPFTVWRFKLDHRSSEDEETIRNELLMMAGLIDLHLIGKGYYVTEDAEICKDLGNAYVDFEQLF